MKAQYVIDLLKSNSNRFTPAQLEKVTGTPRRARRALFLARKAGVTLEALRDSGRAVTAYVFSGTALPTVAAAPARKASKAASAKVAAKAKTVKAVKVDHSASNKLIAKAIKTGTLKTAKVVSVEKSPAEVAAIKAKNLETMKAVSMQHAKHEDRLTPEQKAIREEFYAEEEAEARAEERAALRANAPAFLFKESYSE